MPVRSLMERGPKTAMAKLVPRAAKRTGKAMVQPPNSEAVPSAAKRDATSTIIEAHQRMSAGSSGSMPMPPVMKRTYQPKIFQKGA